MAWGTPFERFWGHIEVDFITNCWNWTGGKKKAGYGQFSVNGYKVIAHRWSYEYYIGPIPDGLEVDHTCENESCVNPAHLEAITHEENIKRRNAAKTHCKHGHEYTSENTGYQTDTDGYVNRYCKRCNRDKHARRRAAR